MIHNEIVVVEDEKKQVVLTWLGEESGESKWTIVLEGDRSEIDVYGVFYGTEAWKKACNVSVIHKGKDTRANVFACGVVVDSSSLDFSGLLRVEHGAKRTRTFFRANLMILSAQASAFTFPGLEIEENDIAQGGHAATVGKVNEEQMFYLMSRGLDGDESRKLVIKGFFEPVLKLIDQDVQENIRERLGVLLD
ncbi:MAG: SufD family Fe-S cluster assembly protein [bacterium]|nr:SufD family Fe-S cluster assembly protein [bacterium]